MKVLSSKRWMVRGMAMTLLVACGGGGDTTPPVTTPASLSVAPTSVTFGALGSQRQLTATYKDASNNTTTGPAVLFTRTGNGNIISVTSAGLVVSTAVGTGDTVVATGSGFTVKVPVTVTQVPATLVVGSTSATPDTLFAATRTRQFSAVAKDSNNNAIASPAITWTSLTTGVATVSAAGLVTAVADGSASIQAAAGALNAARTVVVRRLAMTHSVTPTTGTISVNAGTAGPFTGAAADSAGQAIPLTWVSRNTSVFTISPSTGTTTTATATGNGSARLVLSIPVGVVDSAAITVSNQTVAPPPSAIAVSVGDFFFKSGRNNTQNPAVDTVAAGGTVTWTWVGAANHSVLSTGATSFTSSTIKATGTYAFTFNTIGTYTYECGVHGSSMTGTIVVK